MTFSRRRTAFDRRRRNLRRAGQLRGGLLLGGAPRVKRARFVVKDWGGRAVSSVADKYPGNEKSG